MREPAGIVLRDNQRATGPEAPELVERVHASIDPTECIGARAVPELAGAVGSEERDIDPRLLPERLDRQDILFILAVAAVLVLDLHHEDRAAPGHQQAPHLRSQPGDIAAYGGEVAWVLCTQLDIGCFEEPPRNASQLPLGTDIGTRPEHHPEPFLLGHLDIGSKVRDPREVPAAGLWLMEVPEVVGRHHVAPHGLEHLEAMPPVRTWDAAVVHLTAAQDGRLTVNEEVFLPDLKRMLHGFPHSALQGLCPLWLVN